MDQSPPKHVAIIGAGLSVSLSCYQYRIINRIQGLSLAIALHEQSIRCSIYEFRQESYDIGDGVLLGPNALRVLDSLGVYERIRNKGYNLERSDFKNEQGETTGVYYVGHQNLYGYKALRIYRWLLLKELRTMVEERGIQIHFERKFTGIISESAEAGVTFEFADGSVENASILVGADGLHSKVRRSFMPDAIPTYSGVISIMGKVPKSQLRFSSAYDNTCINAILATAGAFFLIPQGIDGDDFLVFSQRRFAEKDRVGWEQFSASKGELLAMLRENQSSWPDLVQSTLENIEPESVFVWPFYTVPKLESWRSPNSRIILVGDAAHGIPPSGGQGVNQAFEDTYTLSLLLSKLSSKVRLGEALKFWQTFRQERVDKVITLTHQMNTLRLPAAERAKALETTSWEADRKISGEDGQLRWLYEPVLDDTILTWVSKQE